MTNCKKDLLMQFLRFMHMDDPLMEIMIDEFLDEIYNGCESDD